MSEAAGTTAAELVADGAEGLSRVKVYDYDLLILDWELPGTPGIEILKAYRARGGLAPVLMLTGRGSVNDKEMGLDAGADDYLTKPFHAKELTARLRALLRRPEGYLGDILKVGAISLDRTNYRVMRGAEEVKLLPKEFALLEFFMRNPDRVFTAEAIMIRVWSTEADPSTDAFRSTLKRLRQKLEAAGIEDTVVETVHGAGYRFNSK